jgi:hypothetical protein
MALQYPSWHGLGVDANSIMDACDSGFDRARALKQQKESGEILARLTASTQQGPLSSLGGQVTGPWGADQQVNGGNSLSGLGRFVPQQAAQTQTYAPQQPVDPATARIQSALGETPASGNPMESYYSSIRAAESSGNDAARNPNSSATGRYQFTEGTWNDLARNNPQLGLTPEGRLDPAQQEKAIRAFTGQNAKTLSQAGIQVNPANLYAAHFLGAGGATQALSQADNVPMAQVVGQEVVQANPFLANMTVGDFKQWTGKKTGYGQQGGAVQAVNAMAAGAPMQVADASGQVAPQQAQGRFPPAPSNSPLDDEAFMRQAFANPLTRDYAIAAAKSRIEAQKNANDPMKRIEFQKAELELQKLRQEIGRGPERKTTTIDGRLIDSQTGQVIAQFDERTKPTSDMQEYEFALKQGFQGSFVDFQLAQKKAGATNVTTNVGEGDKFYENLDKKNAETFSALSEEGLRGRSKLSQIGRLESLLASSPQGAEGAFKQMLGEWGIETKDMNNLQAAQALINELVPQQRQPGSGPMSDADLALFKQSLPRIINQPGGNQQIIDTMRGITQYQMRMGEIADAVADREMTPKQGREAIRALENPLDAFTKTTKRQGQAQSPSGASRGAGGSAGRQRARNPQTGQVMEWDGNQWSPLQ